MIVEDPRWIPPEQTGLSEPRPIPIRHYQMFLNRVFGERELQPLPQGTPIEKLHEELVTTSSQPQP